MIDAMVEMAAKPAIREIKVPVEEPTCLIPTRAKTAPAAQDVEAIKAKMTPIIGSDTFFNVIPWFSIQRWMP